MKRSKFLKLTASTMATTTFFSFPAFSKNIAYEEDEYIDNFSYEGLDPDNGKFSIIVEIKLKEDSPLEDSILLYYYRKTDTYDKVACHYYFKKLQRPYNKNGFDRYEVKLKPDQSYNCTGYDEYDKMYAVELPNDAINNQLKSISTFDFKPWKRSERSKLFNENLEQSKYSECIIYGSDQEKLFSLTYLKTSEDCFLTTACVTHKGLADDCDELEKLRIFRDNYMMSHPEGKKMISEYYNIAPAIVETLNNQCNDDVFEFIYNELVLRCIKMIDKGKNELAMYYYKSFTKELEKRVLITN